MVAFLVTVLILDGLFLMAVILMQAGKGGGLAAVGGGAGTDTFIGGGRQAASLMTRSTWTAAGLFLGLALVLAVMSSSRRTAPDSILQQEFQSAPAVPQPLDLPGTGGEAGGFEGQEPASAPGAGTTGDAGDPSPIQP